MGLVSKMDHILILYLAGAVAQVPSFNYNQV